jgi:thiamine biosynthesis lipoprotein
MSVLKDTRILMGMPITVEISDSFANKKNLDQVFSYFDYVEKKFSVYRDDSEISLINKNKINAADCSFDMKEVLELCEETKQATNGYFDIKTPNGKYDTSGLVKGWSIYNAAQILKKEGFYNFYIEAGGDIQAYGKNSNGQYWRAGIRNPFREEEIVKAVLVKDMGIATSGTYVRGQHIYNPYKNNLPITEIVSLTIIGPNVYEADRFATAAFAMGREGINFVEKIKFLEGYMIDKDGIATMTSGFEKYVIR